MWRMLHFEVLYRRVLFVRVLYLDAVKIRYNILFR